MRVRNGRQRVWRRAESCIERLLGSACLRTPFPAVEVAGEAYWNGGHMGNPARLPLRPAPPRWT